VQPIAPHAGPPNRKVEALNAVRTQIREDTLRNLSVGLDEGRRIFSLAAPTGAGKTLTLLALANAILKYRNGGDALSPAALHGIIYNLPFLSITEQVESVCEGLVPDKFVLRADSSANHPTMDMLMRDADKNPDAAEKLLREDFAELIFDSPLVITTFVQFFETLMSHRNATLLKLPNFARSVIVVDEVQALPPRLYVFFTAYLNAFCRKFDAYVILSTATMPKFRLTKEPALKPAEFFLDYQEPFPLVSTDHFQGECFRRYVVEPRWGINSLEVLADSVVNETAHGNSVMVVLNTIADTRELYRLLNTAPKKRKVLLLNTRFIPRDRRVKIQQCKKLPKRTPLVLITTQLIEAGVDIDFPVVFRDLCPLPNLVQTAGRCNRHNRLPDIGRVILVDIKSEQGRSHAEIIYSQDMDRWYLDFTRKEILQPIREDEFLEVQQRFFHKVSVNLSMGKHPGLRDKPEHSNLMLCIRDAAFEDAGRFKLIQQEGEQFSFYVSESAADDAFEVLEGLAEEIVLLKKTGNFKEVRLKKIKLETHLRRMRERVVQARIKAEIARCLGPEDPVMGIYKLTNRNNYTEEFGLELDKDDQFF
jgi:CRISPR-associated endonuclease/helicase Cas3